ncbi:hypothetical protein K461DRAFT_235699 [Myriangium duriaei CBS 260.36]|uniref:Uncharacterized protein n=1 Tax=Myriangium duriaei CBS 260.36 TaxID=1168546 RepID=A0A9P4JEC5_9PEZI|nr:hypothetical protein K461DRAFT_235699 [Myriangium duriaei CBS 260.36]
MGTAGTLGPHPAADSHMQRLPPTFGFIPTQHLFAAVTVALLAVFQWPLRWMLSGAPLLTYALLIGAANGDRVLRSVPLWTLAALINLSYSVAATSWLLYWAYLTACYPAIFLVCLFQFSSVSGFTRRKLRTVLRGLQLTNDTIAFFDLPALEIDVDVEGLMCIRGMSFSFSSLTIIAYGVEVGIKLSDDMEIALVTDKVTIKLFRRIDVSDVYGNVKGGLYEMTFGKLAKKTRNEKGESLMVENTPLLEAAAATGDTRRRPGMMPRMQTLTEHMTAGKTIEDSSIRGGFESIRQISPDDDKASKEFRRLITWIEETSSITTSRNEAEEALKDKDDDPTRILDNTNNIRAAICSQLHDKPTIPHPAKKSIKVSTLQHLSPPHVRSFLHRFPLLLRCLLNPIAYFHPVYIESITAGGSGRFLQHILQEKVFPTDTETGIKNLKQRISAWLSDANFVFQVVDVIGMSSVPITTAYDIVNNLTFDDVMAYRTLPREVDLTQIVRLGGADARIAVPSFLLPHHEHLLPPPPTEETEGDLKEEVEQADGKPKTVQKERELVKKMKDEANISISAHVRLPACFDQSLLDFIAALVKATKIIEMEKDDPVEKETSGFRQLAKGFGADMRDSIRRVAIDAATNDRWIAKLVGKVTKNLETAMGDVGYSGDIPVPLEIYRQKAESLSKLMA